ncbi:uncharacterized protein LOC100376242 [Saccoglossus kowalevskii]|uniref:Girdin-like n=1 Tax=Saccoglossus kowalevskii TaxID=10224 RepID=A0ABM0GI96_SACKO|nr:PREDICTED: girdin-like [Saccoglossus kowalevskii]
MADSVEVVFTLKEWDVELSTPHAVQIIFQLILGAEGHHDPVSIKNKNRNDSASIKFGISQTAVPVLKHILSSSKQSVFRELGVTSIKIGEDYKQTLKTQCNTAEYIQSSCAEFYRTPHHSFQDELLAQLILHFKVQLRATQDTRKQMSDEKKSARKLFVELENKVECLKIENSELRENTKRVENENHELKKVIANSTLDSDMNKLNIKDSSEEKSVSSEIKPTVKKAVMETKDNDGLHVLPSDDLQVDTESFGSHGNNDESEASSSAVQPEDSAASQEDNRTLDVDTTSFGNQDNKEKLKAFSSVQPEDNAVTQKDSGVSDDNKKKIEELRLQLERQKFKRGTYEKNINALGAEYSKDADDKLKKMQNIKTPDEEWIESSQNTEVSLAYELKKEKETAEFYENYLEKHSHQATEQNKQEASKIETGNPKLVGSTETQDVFVSSKDSLVSNKQQDEKPLTQSLASSEQNNNKRNDVESQEEPYSHQATEQNKQEISNIESGNSKPPKKVKVTTETEGAYNIESKEEPIITEETEDASVHSQEGLSNNNVDEKPVGETIITCETQKPGMNASVTTKMYHPVSEEKSEVQPVQDSEAVSREESLALPIPESEPESEVGILQRQLKLIKKRELNVLMQQKQATIDSSSTSSSKEDNKIIEFVVNELPKNDWRPLVRCLGLSDVEIEEVEENTRSDLRETKRNALVKWRRKENLDKCTGTRIVMGMRECKLNQLADKVCMEFNISEKSTLSTNMAAIGGSGDFCIQVEEPESEPLLFTDEICDDLETLDREYFNKEEMRKVQKRLKLTLDSDVPIFEVCTEWEKVYKPMTMPLIERRKKTNFFVRVMRDLPREDIVDVLKKYWSGNGLIGPSMSNMTSFQKIPFSTRNKLNNQLSIEKPNGSDWRIIAEIAKFPDYQNLIQLWQQKGNGGEQVLQTWQGRTDATIGNLYKIFVENDMNDCAKLLE